MRLAASDNSSCSTEKIRSSLVRLPNKISALLVQVSLLAILIFITGCGGSNSSSAPAPSSPAPQAIAVTVSPSSINLTAGTTQQFTATVSGTSNASVTWSVNGTTGGNSTVGTISSMGLYAAPSSVPNPSMVTVTANSVADSSKSGSATVTVTAIPLALQSVSPNNAAPGTILTITGTGFDASASPIVLFTESNGVSVQVPLVALTATTISVALPPFVDSNTGLFTAGTATVAVIQTGSSGSTQSNTLPGLQIQAIPALPSAAGTLTLAYLLAERDFMTNTLESAVKTSIFDTPSLETALVNEVSALDTIISGVQGIVLNPLQSYTIGTFAGQNVTIAVNDLARVDEFLLAVLAAHANATYTATAAAIPGRSFRLTTADPPACASTQAATAYQDYATNANPNPDDLVNYLHATTACGAAQAIQAGSAVVLGSGAVALGVMAAVLGPTTVAGAALALPAAVLTVIALEVMGAEIMIGGAIGQPTPAAVQLLQNGLHDFEHFLYALLAKGGAGGILYKMGVDNLEAKAAMAAGLYGAWSLHNAFFSAPPYNGGGTSTSTFKLQINLTGTGFGVVRSFPGSVSCLIAAGATSGNCAVNFDADTIVALNPTAILGSSFSGWSGACSGNGACSVVMNSDQTVGAGFTQVAQVFKGNFQLTQMLSDLAGDQYSVTVNSNMTVELTQVDIAITGTAILTGNWSATLVTCISSACPASQSGDIDTTAPVAGASPNMLFGPVLFTGGMGSFTGVLGSSTITGTMDFLVNGNPALGLQNNDLVQQITLNQTP